MLELVLVERVRGSLRKRMRIAWVSVRLVLFLSNLFAWGEKVVRDAEM